MLINNPITSELLIQPGEAHKLLYTCGPDKSASVLSVNISLAVDTEDLEKYLNHSLKETGEFSIYVSKHTHEKLVKEDEDVYYPAGEFKDLKADLNFNHVVLGKDQSIFVKTNAKVPVIVSVSGREYVTEEIEDAGLIQCKKVAKNPTEIYKHVPKNNGYFIGRLVLINNDPNAKTDKTATIHISKTGGANNSNIVTRVNIDPKKPTIVENFVLNKNEAVYVNGTNVSVSVIGFANVL